MFKFTVEFKCVTFFYFFTLKIQQHNQILLVQLLGDYHIQNFYLWRYIVPYTVKNSALHRSVSGAAKSDFRTYIQWYTSRIENLNYDYPHSYALLLSRLKLERCKPHKAAHHPTKCAVIDDVKLFPTGYTVANFWHYPIKHGDTKASELEFSFSFHKRNAGSQSWNSQNAFQIIKQEDPDQTASSEAVWSGFAMFV